MKTRTLGMAVVIVLGSMAFWTCIFKWSTFDQVAKVCDVLIFGFSSSPGLPLEKKADRLAPGMSKTQVANLFANDDATTVESGNEEIFVDSTLFQTNAQIGSQVYYSAGRGLFEIHEGCNVYFDTNNSIIGYRYSREGYIRDKK